MQSKSSQHVGDVGHLVVPIGRWQKSAMTTWHRDREQDRFVTGITDALEPVHLIDIDVLRIRPAATAIAAQPTIADRELNGPSGGVQLSHPIDERVHRRAHDST